MCMAECPSARKTPKAGKLSGPARARIISLRRFHFPGKPTCPDIARIKLPHSGRLLIQPRAAISDARIGRREAAMAAFAKERGRSSGGSNQHPAPLNAKTTRSRRTIVPFTHLAREGAYDSHHR